MNSCCLQAKICMLLHKGCKVIGKTFYYENKYGIKALNKPLFVASKNYSNADLIKLDPNDMYLSFDGLKDNYTLAGIKVKESPHFDLVKRIKAGKSILECDYVLREKTGQLDGRYGQVINDVNLDNHIRAYTKSLKDIEQDVVEPPLIYIVDGYYYVLDGKHRVAMCLLLNKTILCRLIPSVELAQDPYNISLFQMMWKRQFQYKRNLKLMDSFMNMKLNSKQII